MPGRALSASPLARLLLELVERAADGRVDVGGRRIVLRAGEVVDVVAAPEDPSLEQFLHETGRLDGVALETLRAQPSSRDTPEEVLLAKAAGLGEEGLAAIRRSLWLGRFVKGIATDEREARESTWFVPEAASPAGGARVGLVRLMLDALARRAAEGDAELVGEHTDYRLEWLESPHRAGALRWAGFDEDETQRAVVRALLAREPAVAPRIAALVRAGLARLVPPRTSAPPPPPRPVSLAPGADVRSTHGTRVAIEPPRVPDLSLEPGQGSLIDVPRDLAVPLATVPPAGEPLADPLDPLERRIAALEQSRAPDAERAAAWRELARVWQTRYGSIEEAARAYRESSAADPTDRVALEQAAMACAAMGEPKLALAYARAAMTVAPAGSERARLGRLTAIFARRAGDPAGALDALKAAAAEDPTDPTASELVARSLFGRGDLEDAARHAAASAERWRLRRRERAEALYLWTLELRPRDVEVAESLAASMVEGGRAEAAAALLGAIARRIDDLDLRRRLLFEGAHHAEQHGGADLAAAMLLLQLDAEPELDIVYEPLVTDLAASPLERAIVLEDIATVADVSSRSGWLERAGRAWLDVSGGIERALPLFADALVADPANDAALTALRGSSTADSQRTALADALERAARREDVPAERRIELAEALARLEDERLGAVHRIAWARRLVASLAPDDADANEAARRLDDAVRLQDSLVAEATRELEAAGGIDATRKLAMLLVDHPAERPRAAVLLQRMLEARPDDELTANHLERVLRTLGDDRALVALLQARVRDARPSAKARTALRLAASLAAAGDHRGAADAALAALAVAPEDHEALARLERAARRLADDDLLRDALERRVAAPAFSARERARDLSALAALLANAGALELAVERARQALATDPRAADAAWLIVRFAGAVPPNLALDALVLARAVLGEIPSLLAAIARAASALGETAAELDALEAWARMTPLDPEPALALLDARCRQGEPRAIQEASRDALASEALGPETAAGIRAAATRLRELGSEAEAAMLAILALDRLGGRDHELRRLAVEAAEASAQPALRVAAAERVVATTPKAARHEPLARLAALQRELGDRPAEVHALLRLLALDPHEDGTLARLETLYAQAGEAERLLAVMALRLAAAGDDTTRRERLLTLASAAAQVAGDRNRAAAYVHEALALESSEEADVARCAATLVTLGLPADAVEALAVAAERSEPGAAGRLGLRAVTTAELFAKDPDLALRAAVRALDRAPSNGALLVCFERLSLAAADVELGRSTYSKLVAAAMGPHGRRALHYRAARWLERLGEQALALEQYVKAFEHAPTDGVIFKSIGRLAHETKRFEPLAAACLTLAESTTHVDTHVTLLERAAEVCENGLRDTMRGFELRMRAWELAGTSDLEHKALAAARAIAADDPAQGEVAFERVLATLRTRAEKAWDADDRLATLTKVARVVALDQGRLAEGLEVLRSAFADATRDGIEPEVRVRGLCDLAELVARTPDGSDDAIVLLDEALALVPSDARATSLRDALDAARVTIPEASPSAHVQPEPAGQAAETAAQAVGAVEVDEDAVTRPGTVEAVSELDQHSAVTRPGTLEAAVDPTLDELVNGAPTEEHALLRLSSPAAEPEPRRSRSEAPEPDAPPPSAVVDARASEPPAPPMLADAIEPEPLAPPPSVRPVEVDTRPTVQMDTTGFLETLPAPGSEEADLAAPPSEAIAPAPLPDADALRRAFESDDEAAATELARAFADDPARVFEAAHVLRVFVRRDPTRVRALRALHHLAARRGSVAEAEITAEILGTFDPAYRVDRPPRYLEDAVSPKEVGAALHDGATLPWVATFALVWDAGLPEYRRPLTTYGVAGTDRVIPQTPTPLGRAWAAAAWLLETPGTNLYLRRSGSAEIFAAATQPPCVIAGAAVNEPEPVLRFRLARALTLAQPGHVLLATLSAPEGALLTAAVRAAFGPPADEKMDRTAAGLAASLWQTMPSRAQQKARDLLARAQMPLDYSAAHGAAQLAALKAGLFACGSVRTTLEAYVAEDPELAPAGLRAEGAYLAACRTSPSFAALVRFALSDTFLSARARAVRLRP